MKRQRYSDEQIAFALRQADGGTAARRWRRWIMATIRAKSSHIVLVLKRCWVKACGHSGVMVSDERRWLLCWGVDGPFGVERYDVGAACAASAGQAQRPRPVGG